MWHHSLRKKLQNLACMDVVNEKNWKDTVKEVWNAVTKQVFCSWKVSKCQNLSGAEPLNPTGATHNAPSDPSTLKNCILQMIRGNILGFLCESENIPFSSLLKCYKSGQVMILGLSPWRFFKQTREAVGKLTKLKRLIEIPINLPPPYHKVYILNLIFFPCLKMSPTSIARLVTMSIMSKQLLTHMTCSHVSICVLCQWIWESLIFIYTLMGVRDRLQILLLISSECKQIN